MYSSIIWYYHVISGYDIQIKYRLIIYQLCICCDQRIIYVIRQNTNYAFLDLATQYKYGKV